MGNMTYVIRCVRIPPFAHSLSNSHSPLSGFRALLTAGGGGAATDGGGGGAATDGGGGAGIGTSTGFGA